MLGFLFVADGALVMEDDALATVTKDPAQSGAVLAAAIAALSAAELAGDGWAAPALEAALRAAVVEGLGIKPKFAFGPLRVAISGRRIAAAVRVDGDPRPGVGAGSGWPRWSIGWPRSDRQAGRYLIWAAAPEPANITRGSQPACRHV